MNTNKEKGISEKILRWNFVAAYIIGLLCLVISSKAVASPGCDQVNAGAWNTALQSFAIGQTIGQFDNGDQLHFITRGDGQFTLLASNNGGSYIDVLVVNPPGSGRHTVVTPHTLFRILNDAVAGPLIVTATCTPAIPTPSPSRSASDFLHELTKSFLYSRINGLLLTEPSGTSLLNRHAVDANNHTAAMANALPFAYKTLLPLTTYKTLLPFELWIDGGYSSFNNDSTSFGDGHVYVVHAGGDYRINSNMIVGALVQFDWAKDNFDSIASTINGHGWLVGPYFSTRLFQNFFFDLRAAWGRSSNSMSVGPTNGSFDTSRWLVRGNFSGNWLYNRWRLTPSAELAYMAENPDSFTYWTEPYIAGQNVTLGRFQFGPEIGYRFFPANILLEPFAAIRGVWDFENPNVQITNGNIIAPSDFWGRLEGGLVVRMTKGTLIRALASLDGIGAADYSGYTLQCTLSVPLG